MTNPKDPTLRELHACGCCGGTAAQTPAAVDNRPGLPAVSTRAGTHARFKTSLLAGLSSDAAPALAKLGTRDDDDFTIALLDGCAVVADVLSFYNERTANEGFLRTATERRSVLELARTIGYELNPGVAASTWLAFTVEEAEGAPGYAEIGSGTRVQSLPGSGELPQTFETVEPLDADKDWNLLRARHTRPFAPRAGDEAILLQGLATNLRPGDALVVVGDERLTDPASDVWDFCRVKSLKTFPNADADKAYTRVALDRPLAHAARNAKAYALRLTASLFGHNAPDWRAMPKDVRDAYDVRVEREAPPPRTELPGLTIAEISDEAIRADGGTVHLEGVRPEILPGSWLVMSTARQQRLYRVKEAAESARSGFTLNAKTTRLTLEGPDLADFDKHVRDAAVFAQSEDLPWGEEPLQDELSGKEVLLDRRLARTLPPGRRLLIHSAVPPGEPGAEVSDVVTVVRSEQADEKHDRVVLAADLSPGHRVDRVALHGNVAFATHGETVADEVLGSGDANAAHQKFTLREGPLTYVPASNASGGESTLQLWVNGVRWREVSSFYGQGRRDRVYVTRHLDEKTVLVITGDGRRGARLPTGRENVRATYRKGIGLPGLVRAGQLSLLMTRPLGVRGVTNPLAAAGAADPQVLADARRNAPNTVLTLDRVVSLQDYEDFARGFSGITKAMATGTWNAHSRGVFLTLAGPARSPEITEASATRAALIASLRSLGDPLVPVEARSYTPAQFQLAGTVYAVADRDPAKLEAAVREAMRAAFSFDARSFGQPVTLGEVVAVIQNVPGVRHVDPDALYTGPTSALSTHLPAPRPRDGAAASAGVVVPATLLTLDESSLPGLKVVKEVKP